jgi:hypothetical protein
MLQVLLLSTQPCKLNSKSTIFQLIFFLIQNNLSLQYFILQNGSQNQIKIHFIALMCDSSTKMSFCNFLLVFASFCCCFLNIAKSHFLYLKNEQFALTRNLFQNVQAESAKPLNWRKFIFPSKYVIKSLFKSRRCSPRGNKHHAW